MTTTIHFTADNFNGSPDFFNHRDPLPENLRGMTHIAVVAGSTFPRIYAPGMRRGARHDRATR